MNDTAISIILIAITLGGLLFVDYQIDKYRCQKQTETLNCKYEYSFWTKCVVVKGSGQKVLLKQLRDFNE